MLGLIHHVLSWSDHGRAWILAGLGALSISHALKESNKQEKGSEYQDDVKSFCAGCFWAHSCVARETGFQRHRGQSGGHRGQSSNSLADSGLRRIVKDHAVGLGWGTGE